MILITKLSEAEQNEKKITMGVYEGKLIIRETGSKEKGYGAYVMEFKGEQLLVKHIIKEGCKTMGEALAEGSKYKAEHPKFNWRTED